MEVLFPDAEEASEFHHWNEVTDSFLQNVMFLESWFYPEESLFLGDGGIFKSAATGVYTRALVGTVPQGGLQNPVPSGPSIRSSKAPRSGGVISVLEAPIAVGDIVGKMVNGNLELYALTDFVSVNEQTWVKDGVIVNEPEFDLGESFWIDKPTDWEKVSSVWP